jgi:hypothetical protein
MRNLVAHQYDRNCVLAATAAQIMTALHLECPIRAIVIGPATIFDVGMVASRIELVDPGGDGKTALIASAGVVAFWRAAGKPLDELINAEVPKQSAAIEVATAMVDNWIDNGRLKALVMVLDTCTTPGEMTELKWLNVLKDG